MVVGLGAGVDEVLIAAVIAVRWFEKDDIDEGSLAAMHPSSPYQKDDIKRGSSGCIQCSTQRNRQYRSLIETISVTM